MVHWWQDPEVEARLAIVYVDILFLLLGGYGWEYLQSFGVEYAIIRGRLPFRWPLVPYLLGRVFALVILILLAIETSPLSGGFACQSGMISIAISGDIAIGASSANFMIRTWVIWKDSRLVHLLLLLLTLGHWSILALDVVNMKAFKSNGACIIQLAQPAVTAGVLVYTMCYDFLVLVLSTVKLLRQPSKSPLRERLLAQGLLYFAVATMANTLPVAFAFLGSDGMTSITGSFAITASTIASCRAVRSLLGLRTPHSSDMLGDSVENNDVLTTHLQGQIMSISVGTC